MCPLGIAFGDLYIFPISVLVFSKVSNGPSGIAFGDYLSLLDFFFKAFSKPDGSFRRIFPVKEKIR